MPTYIKIHSNIEIDKEKVPPYNARFFFDYFRDEDEEDYPYEYFLELDDEDEEDEILVAEFQSDCRELKKWLNENIGRENFFITNMSGTYL